LHVTQIVTDGISVIECFGEILAIVCSDCLFNDLIGKCEVAPRFLDALVDAVDLTPSDASVSLLLEPAEALFQLFVPGA
jgi:hypothetical protein